MDSYTALLEKTRVPQRSLQKFAVISIFSKLRSAAGNLDPDSEPGRDAISQCLNSSSPAVVDQAVRELCRLVVDSKLDLSRGLLELQSALEGSDLKFVSLFVKALGFLVRVGFERNRGTWRFVSPEDHPFLKILLCRADVYSELVRQVVLFMGLRSRGLGMVVVCEFLRPFVNFVILRIPFSDSSASLFARQLTSSMASFCCSVPGEAMPILKLLMGCLRYLPHKNLDPYEYLEVIVDAYTVVLRHTVGTRLAVVEAQFLGVQLSETILSLLACLDRKSGGSEPIVELVRRLLVVQKDLALQYVPELSSLVLSLFFVLIHSEFEHEQLSLLKLLIFLSKWKHEKEYALDRTAFSEEVLFTIPVINLMSSTSRLVKGAATDLLIMLEKQLLQLLRAPRIEVTTEEGFPLVSSPGSIVYRLLQHLWFQDQFSQYTSFFVNFSLSGKTYADQLHDQTRPWAAQLREYSLWMVARRKSSQPTSLSHEIFFTEMPPLLCAIAGVLAMHQSLGNTAIDLLTAVGVMDPKQGIPLLLAILFYSNIFTRKDFNDRNMLPKLLGMLPSLASHSVMIPLVIQTILPMLQKDVKPVLYATGTRLLCQTWAINDRAFGSLQAALLPKGFTEFKSERNICISLAASVRDVCRHNPDRGVDLILSVSACIESQDPVIQAIGFQSLAYLCEADAIDFYTAWEVVAKHMLDYSTDPGLAKSICLLLKWGAMDAEAYLEASRNVLQILWDIVTSGSVCHVLQWAKARVSAIESLTAYEVSRLEEGIPDLKGKIMDVLLSEANFDVLRAIEVLQVKIITHEHMNRRRSVKEKKVAVSKTEKLLDVFPQVLFPSGKKLNARQLPGAALLCLSFTPKNLKNEGLSRGPLDVHAGYESGLVEIAASLQLSRNLFVALLSMQSWKSFMCRWMRANILCHDPKSASISLDKTYKAANDILKSLMKLAEESVPRSAENIALAIGALCAILPPSAHTIKSTASKFLLNWLFQYEHEHRQWSAAMSLGFISSCLHVTDHKQKLQNITGLTKVLCGSKSILVKGACGIGLGISCQDLLTRVQAANNDDLEKGNYRTQEVDLLGTIIRALLLTIGPLSPASYSILESPSAYLPLGGDLIETDMTSDLFLENHDDLEEDIWGVSGLVIGLGSSISAIYRSGAHDIVLKIKDLILSWIPHVDSLTIKHGFSGEGSDKVLSVGSCLALPTMVAFLRRVEMMDDNELDYLLTGYKKLTSELVSVKKSGIFHQSLLMAACTGAGSLLACVLNEGVHPVENEWVKGFLELCRKCYSDPYPSIIQFGGMLGVVNAMGAAAGILVHGRYFTSSTKTVYDQKESYVLGPLLSSSTCEPHLTELMQEIFLVAQNSDDLQMQRNAAWALSFLRSTLWSEELPSAYNNMGSATDSSTVSNTFSDDNLVMKLSMWLMHPSLSGAGDITHVGTIMTILRCLSQAPRLPNVNWGSIIRRCMRHEAKISEVLPPDSAPIRGILREESIKFSIAHANQFDALQTFLDELSDLSRFSTLEPNLQSCLLLHLVGLTKVFSDSRLEKLFDDIAEFFYSNSLYQLYDPDQKCFLRISCWNGLCQCLDEASINSLEYISNAIKCMEVLFTFLPAPEPATVIGADAVRSEEEWFEMVKCLAKVEGDWLLNFLQVDLVQGDGLFDEITKKILLKAKLVRIGSISVTELGRLKAYILNSKSHGIWNVLVEVVAALQYAEGSVKRQWLVDAVEISCVSRYPSTSMRFLGLLSGSFCKYMPLLTLNQLTVLSDLPVTLTSLLTESGWEATAQSIVPSLYVSTERIYNRVTQTELLDSTPSAQPIDESEDDGASFLLQVLHHTCVSLKEYLPLEKQLGLASMVVK